MWRILHVLFGCEYIIYRLADEWHVCRVRTAPNGMRYIVFAWIIPMDELSSGDWRPLTFV